jgi:sugar porter (SP) family MFS transporter
VHICDFARIHFAFFLKKRRKEILGNIPPPATGWGTDLTSRTTQNSQKSSVLTDHTNEGSTGAHVFRIAFVAAIGGFLFGFDLGMIGAANVYLEDQFHLNAQELGFATASATLGCIFGPFLGSFLCDSWGRRNTMIAAAVLLAVSAIFTAVPDFFSDGSAGSIMNTFNIFRFIGGVGVGLCSIASPMYIAEVAPSKTRGALGMMYQLAIVVGHAVAPAIGYMIVKILQSQGIEDSVVAANPWQQAWRWMFFSETICVALFVAFVFSLPRSPRWLAGKGRLEEARQVLSSMVSPEYAQSELANIRTAIENEDEGSWRELFSSRGVRFALTIGILLAFFNNWTGWSVIGGYVPRLFESAGFTRDNAIRNYVFVYGAMGVMTVVSLLLSDRIGRRPLWMFASLLGAAIMLLTGFVFHWDLSGGVVVLVIILVTIPHGIALGGLPWLMMSELYPTRLRAKAVAITTTILWCFIFFGSWIFPRILDFSESLVHSEAAAFWLFTGICILSFVFGRTVMPETKGRTLEDIGSSWNKS